MTMESPAWSLVQFTSDKDADPTAGIGVAGRVLRLPGGWPKRMVDVLDGWDHWSAELKTLDLGELDTIPDAVLTAPITYPRKVICTGSNYYDHAKEMGSTRPSPSAEPFFFLKPPTTTVIGPNGVIPMPAGPDPGLDWEVELGVIVSRRCKSVDETEAMDAVAGYVVAIDMSARALFARPDAALLSHSYDWFRHKSLDGFCPIGPGIVPSWLVADAGELDIALSVNGVTKQSSNTRELVTSIGGLIAAVSRYVTLEPGDLILTGTPAGVGMPRGEFLGVGDELAAEIEGLGRLVAHVG